ncbi:MAG: ATP-binding protein [Terracidiphilus sp.]|nr:ATP-binding protein [Terracidiphilus sp.]
MLSPAVTPPEFPTPADVIAAAIDHVGALHGLPLEDRLWLARHGQELQARAGEVLFEEGAPAEQMMLILKGEIHVRRQHGGPMALFIGRTGQMTGLLPFSRMKGYGGQGFAVTDCWVLAVHRSKFDEMLRAIPSMGQRVVSTLLDRVREVTRIEQQAEKLSALGKLAGNLAHELNNPASAAQRAASSLVIELSANRANRFKLINLCLTDEQIDAIEAWERNIFDRNALLSGPADSLLANPVKPSVSEDLAREEAIRVWLNALSCPDSWEIAAQLAEQAVAVADLDELPAFLGPAEICVLLQYFSRYLRSTRSVETLVSSTARIFDLISAVKAYSSMDRAPILEVDVREGLDATLQMLQSRIGSVRVVRNYAPDLPCISAYAGELNQVWTALIENALDALAETEAAGGVGELRISARIEADMLLVEIGDSGPGIRPELQDRIFEPFFTTKPPGHGLGLGLDNAMRIVRKHRGHLGVRSEPGDTCFRVRLPLDQLQAY